MKCPRCNSLARLLETRAKDDNTVRRRYECANFHRFTTIEFAKPETTTRRVPDRANRSTED